MSLSNLEHVHLRCNRMKRCVRCVDTGSICVYAVRFVLSPICDVKRFTPIASSHQRCVMHGTAITNRRFVWGTCVGTTAMLANPIFSEPSRAFLWLSSVCLANLFGF